MFKKILLSLCLAFSSLSFATSFNSNSDIPDKQESKKIEYTVKLFFIPKTDNILKGHLRGTPVKIIEQQFIVNLEKEPYNFTKLTHFNKNTDLGYTYLVKNITKSDNISLVMVDKDSLTIDNATDFSLSLNVSRNNDILINDYTIKFIRKYGEVVSPECIAGEAMIKVCDTHAMSFELHKKTINRLDNKYNSKPSHSLLTSNGFVIEIDTKQID